MHKNVCIRQILSGGHEVVQANLYHPSKENTFLEMKRWKSVFSVLQEKKEKIIHSNIESFLQYFQEECEFRGKIIHEINYKTFSIEYDGQLQGCMIIRDQGVFSDNSSFPAIKVELLEVAPWNNRYLVDKPRFETVGMRLMEIARLHSIEMGFQGCITLVAYPLAEGFYSERLGMKKEGVMRNTGYKIFVLHPGDNFKKMREKQGK